MAPALSLLLLKPAPYPRDAQTGGVEQPGWDHAGNEAHKKCNRAVFVTTQESREANHNPQHSPRAHQGDLVSDYFEVGVQIAVWQTTCETVEAVTALLADRPSGTEAVALVTVAHRLDLDTSATSRRIRVVVKEDYLVNHEARKGRPLQLIMGALSQKTRRGYLAQRLSSQEPT